MRRGYSTLRSRSSIALALFAVLFLSACEESIPAIDMSEQNKYFSLYGYLLTGADTSSVRVIPYREMLERPGPGPIDAKVVSEHAASGRKVVWQDSLVSYQDGSFGHVFWTSAVDVTPNSRYTLHVERSDGKAVHAVVNVPPKPRNLYVEVPHYNLAAGYLQDVEWTTQSPAPFVADVSYMVQTILPSSGIFPVTIPYDERIEQISDGWSITIHLEEDRGVVSKEIADRIEVTPDTRVLLRGMRLYLVVPHEEWDPPGGYDPFVISQPKAFSNVENGYGFVGGVADTVLHWQLSHHIITQLQYLNPDSISVPY